MKMIKQIVVVVATATVFITGCQSGLYKVSTSEDDKPIDESVRYYEVDSTDQFVKDNGASPDGILYDEDRMPIKIEEWVATKSPNDPGWSGVLWMFTLGIFPMYESEYMTQQITVKSPIGEKTGSYRVDAKRWHGWIPLFIGYPGLADERDSNAKLPNGRIENIGKERLVKKLAGESLYKDYVAFAKSKNTERKAEILRIKAVSEKVNGLLVNHKFDDAYTLIVKESQPREISQECDKELWPAMCKRVSLAHEEFDTKHVKTLIASGKYEEAIAFCEGKTILSEDDRIELIKEAETARFNEISGRAADMMSKRQYAEALALVAKESGSRKEIRKHAVKSWQTLRRRIEKECQEYEIEEVRKFIKEGKFEEGLRLCGDIKTLSDDVRYELKNEAVEKAVNELNDAKRLISILQFVKDDDGLGDGIVLKLKNLNTVANVPKDVLVAVANATTNDEVVLEIVAEITDKNVLSSLLIAQHDYPVAKALLAKISDPDLVRKCVWTECDDLATRLAYVDAYGSSDEIKKIMDAYPEKITQEIANVVKHKTSDGVLMDEMDKIVKRNRLAKQIPMARERAIDILRITEYGCFLDEGMVYALESIEPKDYRSLVAMMIFDVWMGGGSEKGEPEGRIELRDVETKVGITLSDKESIARLCACLMPEDAFELCCKIMDKYFSSSSDAVEICRCLAKRVEKKELDKVVAWIKDNASKTINFGGFYLGMPKRDWGYLMAYYDITSGVEDVFSWFGPRRMKFYRAARYKIFEKEDGEFWSAFLMEFIPSASKKKTLGETISDAIDSSSFDYQSGYDDHLEERCYIYKSIKYGTKVLFGLETGRLVLEAYK